MKNHQLKLVLALVLEAKSNVKINFGLNSVTPDKIRSSGGYSVGAFLTKRDTIADYIVILSKVLSNIK